MVSVLRGIQARSQEQTRIHDKHDWEGYFESLVEQDFQNNLFFRSGTKK